MAGESKDIPQPHADSQIEKPNHLLPLQIGKRPELVGRERMRALRQAPDFEEQLRQYLLDRGQEPSDTVNYSLMAIEEFRRNVQSAQALRKAIRSIDNPEKKAQMLGLYADRIQIDEFLSFGLSAENAYREYMRSRLAFFEFRSTLSKLNAWKDLLLVPSLSDLSADSKLNENDFAYVEERMNSQKTDSSMSEETMLEALATIYEKGKPKYQKLKEILEIERQKGQSPEISAPKTKREVRADIEALEERARSLWEDEMVRYFWRCSELNKMAQAFAQGKEVIENPEVIEMLNVLHVWEQQHPNTTIGGILVGPPGVGKTTLIRHYIEEKGRHFAYIDLSRDVTRYMLLGSKQIEFQSTADLYKYLVDSLGKMDDKEFRVFFEENASRISEAMKLGKEDSIAVSVSMVKEALKVKGEEQGTDSQKLNEIRLKIVEFVQKAYRRELGSQFANLVKKNGWRDGVLVHALRNDMSVILDEFVQNKDWSVIYGLMTARPEGEWYFADNNETIAIPKGWRMFFTANIGRRYGSFAVPEAMASRGAGLVIEVDYPRPETEFWFGALALSDPNMRFLRSEEDLAKLCVLIYTVFKDLRPFLESQHQAIPISYRTLRSLGEKLIRYKDPKTGMPVYQPAETSFDEALYEVLVDSYSLYEDRTVPKQIVDFCTSAGLLLDDRVKTKVIGWLGEEEYLKRRNLEPAYKSDYQKILDEIRSSSFTMALGDIATRKF